MRRAAALACLAILTTACVPEAATSQGRDVAWLYNIFMLASAGVFVIVIGLLSWSIIRYRGQPGRDVEMPTPTRGNVTLEVIWWSLPAALVVVLAELTGKDAPERENAAADALGLLALVAGQDVEPGEVEGAGASPARWRLTGSSPPWTLTPGTCTRAAAATATATRRIWPWNPRPGW